MRKPGLELDGIEFEFDPAKSASNKLKHAIDFKEARELWESQRVEMLAREMLVPRCPVIGALC